MVWLVTLGPRVRRGNMSGSLRRQRLVGAFLRLAVPHFGVETGLSQQAGMRAALDDPAGVEDDDLVGRDHRRQAVRDHDRGAALRSEEHTSEIQSLMRISYAVFCLKKKHIAVKH